jgi:ABC-type phosphate transport system auxiliary subunit
MDAKEFHFDINQMEFCKICNNERQMLRYKDQKRLGKMLKEIWSKNRKGAKRMKLKRRDDYQKETTFVREYFKDDYDRDKLELMGKRKSLFDRKFNHLSAIHKYLEKKGILMKEMKGKCNILGHKMMRNKYYAASGRWQAERGSE